MINKIIKKNIKSIILLSIASLIMGVVAVLPMILIENMLDTSIAGNSNTKTLLTIGLLYVGLIVFQYLGNLIIKDKGDKLDSTINKEIRYELTKSVLFSGMQQVDMIGANGMIVETLEDIKDLNSSIIPNIINIFYSLSSFILGLIIMIRISAPIVLVAIPLTVIGSVLLKISIKKNIVLSEKSKKSFDNMWIRFKDGVLCGSVIKLFNKENKFLNEFNTANDLAYKDENEHINFNNLFSCISDVIFMLIIVTIFIVGSLGLSKNQISVGGLVAILMYNHMLIDPIFNLIENQKNISKTIFSLKRINNLEKQLPPDERTLINSFNEIKCENVYLSFGTNEVLKDFNLTISKGQRILIKGKTGIGKSSIAKLISGIYYPNSGHVTFDETDSNTHRLNLSYLWQDNVFFDGSIISNITFSNPDISKDKLDKILEITSVDEIIDKYEDKKIGENGVYLSGGEKKRIALARCLVYETDLYILDEPSASLDKKMFAKIFKDVLDYLDGKTIIIIEHENIDEKIFDQVVNIK